MMVCREEGLGIGGGRMEDKEEALRIKVTFEGTTGRRKSQRSDE